MIAKKLTLYIPAVEWFLSKSNLAGVWPKNVAVGEEFLKQIEARQTLRECYEELAALIPCGMSVEEAVEKDLIGIKKAERIYSLFADLLADCDYQRIVLYLPFELLPSNNWRPGGGLERALEQFRRAYVGAWHNLLTFHDVAANFRDGDIIEVSTRSKEPARTVKAAHLAPMLINAGLITSGDLVSILEQSRDAVLKNSLAEGLVVANSMGLLAYEEILAMEESGDRFVQSVAFALQLSQNSQSPEANQKVAAINLKNLGFDLKREYRLIELEDFGSVTAKRRAWLILQNKQALNKKAALAVKDALLSEHFDLNVLRAYASGAPKAVLIEGIREAIEFQAHTDINRARQIFTCLEPVLESLWDKDDQEATKALLKTLRRLANLGIADKAALKKFGITHADLSGPFSNNLGLIAGEIAKLKTALAAIAADEEISKLVYPVILAYGSRVKGYGAENADIDLAVFVKPDTDYNQRPQIQALLKKNLKVNDIDGQPVEFWLKSKEKELAVIDFDRPDANLGESWWTHIMFGAAWLGQEEAVSELKEKLLIPYLMPSRAQIDGSDVRRIYLEEIERDCLLYRLAHRGYYEFYPTANGDERFFRNLDGESAFWDAGYRRLATKLYLTNVFLPKLNV